MALLRDAPPDLGCKENDIVSSKKRVISLGLMWEVHTFLMGGNDLFARPL